MEPLTSAGAAAGDADRSPDRSSDRQRSSGAALRMTAAERASGLWLSLLSGSRMLGLFLILPVFAVHAATMPGGADPMRIGLALGIYGLTQALLQIPFGVASDRFGRKPVITAGLLLMAVGSWVAAQAQTLDGLTVGRALQGAGAVSAAITALLADNTRDSQRSKAMAMVGAMIGVSFALSVVLAPALSR
ncbi:MAG: MFS transporter [Burkholderiaceae bacterium]